MSLHAEEKQLNEERERTCGEFSASGSMIVHVLKRAEKVAQKDHNPALAKKDPCPGRTPLKK